ncbi:MAG TPA: hypothetical protein VIL25_10060 [Vicinamibacterales bacterium]
MRTEIIAHRDDLVVRRMVLEPGEAMPWHTDACDRVTVVVRGDLLRIEFMDGGEAPLVPVTPGMVDWDRPEPRYHRGVNAGKETYEEIVIFFLPRSRH